VKIVIVTPAVPHPFGDTAARWFYVLITELLARGHEVVALAATEEPASRVDEAEQWFSRRGEKLKLHCHRLKVDSFAPRRKLRSLVRPYSEMLQDHAFVEHLHRQLKLGYDVLHLEQLPTGWLGLGWPRVLLNVHFLDVIDWAARNNPSVNDRKALWQAQRATRRLLLGTTNVRLLTPRLEEAARAIHPGGNYRVVPLALDVSLYALQPFVEEPVVGLVGSMHWAPSRSAAERLITRIWPLVKRRIQNAKLHIAGWNALRCLGQYCPEKDLTMAENLAHPREFFSKAAVMVYAPSCGSGMKVKVMESMAYGVPVVTTWEGVEGIDYENGRHCWVAESDEELAEKTCRLLEDRAERQQMRLAARCLIEKLYSPRPVIDKMLAIYQQLDCSGPRPSYSSLCT